MGASTGEKIGVFAQPLDYAVHRIFGGLGKFGVSEMSTIIDYLVELVSRAGHWSYVILFLGAMLECAALLGVFIPGETLI
jgi:hypothetical protein